MGYYKKLYQDALLTISKKEEQIAFEREESLKKLSEKEEQIIQLNFQLDKFRKYLFGKKSEKLSVQQIDVSQLTLFDLQTPIEQQEELSLQAVNTPKKKKPKKRAKGTG